MADSLNRKIREVIKKNKTILNIWQKQHDKKLKKIDELKITGKYKFIDRSKNTEDLCIVLAGYKEFVWKDVFNRLKAYAPKNMDICIMPAGKFSEELDKLCEKNAWSYLSTEENKITLIQNITINLFKNAKYIYKIDEDMFLTKGFFETLKNTYLKVENETHYKVGFVAPLIPINGHTYIDVLEKVNLLEDFEKKFGKAIRDTSPGKANSENPEIAKYLWGESKEELRDIDKISEKLSKEEFKFSICGMRYSIGAILFAKKTWEEMGKFDVTFGNNLGLDEVQLCTHCMLQCEHMVIAHNNLVGHLGYGPQGKAMKEYYEKHREQFKLKQR